MTDRIRVLIIAEAANPEWTSVPLIGWSLSQALAAITDAHIITHVRNRPALLRAGLAEGRDFTAIDNEQVAARLWKVATLLRGGEGKGWTTLSAFSAISYYSFEREVWRRFGARISAREFDIVHRVTPLSPTHQSLIAKDVAACGVPFILGPLNGGVPWPKNFGDRRRAEREWLASVRQAYKLMPGYRSTLASSAAIITASQFTRSDLPGWALARSIYIPENAIDPARFNIAAKQTHAVPLNGAFIGRLVPYKGADMLLEAAADLIRSGRLRLQVVGDGPQRPELEALVERLQIRAGVTFHGWVAHEDVQRVLAACDFMALPSVREFGGGVVVEAMALGVTPIVANYAGPGELVDDNTGIRVDFVDRESLVAGMAKALETVVAAPQMLSAMGEAGRRKVATSLTWAAKAEQILRVYEAVLRGDRNLSGLGLR